jgi:hypothetical protein
MMSNGSERIEAVRGLGRRDFLKVGAGFSLALAAGTALVGCGDAARAPATGHAFLGPADVALFRALAPAVVAELDRFDAAARKDAIDGIVRNVDGACAALDLGSRAELRKLLDLLDIAPLRYALTGVAAWDGAGPVAMQAFLSRWRASRFETLNAGGNVLVRLVASGFHMLPQSWSSAGYPGPLRSMYDAINA